MNAKLERLHLQEITRPLDFAVGDLVKVHYKIKEGEKYRIQLYEGTVIVIANEGAGRTFTVRRISYDVGVERVFPLNSPNIEKIEIVRANKVRRSKLYYLRDKIGKSGRLKEIRRKPLTDRIFARAESLRAELAAKAAAAAPAAEPAEEVAAQAAE